MSTLLILLGILVGGLAGYKYGKKKGLDDSYVIIDLDGHRKLDKLVTKFKNDHPSDKCIIILDRLGCEVLHDDDV